MKQRSHPSRHKRAARSGRMPVRCGSGSRAFGDRGPGVLRRAAGAMHGFGLTCYTTDYHSSSSASSRGRPEDGGADRGGGRLDPPIRVGRSTWSRRPANPDPAQPGDLSGQRRRCRMLEDGKGLPQVHPAAGRVGAPDAAPMNEYGGGNGTCTRQLYRQAPPPLDPLTAREWRWLVVTVRLRPVLLGGPGTRPACASLSPRRRRAGQ